jgi:hypothetical protein
MGIKTKRQTFSGVGRPPRAGVQRDESGRIVRADCKPAETEEQIQSTVLAYRLRAGIPEQELRSQKAESPFGRLEIAGSITPIQYEAGRRFARTLERHRRVVDDSPSPFPSPVSLEAGSQGKSSRPEPDESSINAIKRDYADMMSVLLDLEHSALYRGTSQLLRSVILFEVEIVRDERQIGNLRAGLNVLCRHFGIQP